MSRRIGYEEPFVHYDGPELFHAVDQFGAIYLCLRVETSKFAVVPVSTAKLKDFCQGRIDLRAIFDGEDVRERYEIAAGADAEAGEFALVPREAFPEAWLPEAGFILERPCPTDEGAR